MILQRIIDRLGRQNHELSASDVPATACIALVGPDFNAVRFGTEFGGVGAENMAIVENPNHTLVVGPALFASMRAGY